MSTRMHDSDSISATGNAVGQTASKAASALDDGVHRGADAVSNMAHQAADQVGKASDYVWRKSERLRERAHRRGHCHCDGTKEQQRTEAAHERQPDGLLIVGDRPLVEHRPDAHGQQESERACADNMLRFPGPGSEPHEKKSHGCCRGGAAYDG